jgi:sugar phosphate isomerase/epimerase
MAFEERSVTRRGFLAGSAAGLAAAAGLAVVSGGCKGDGGKPSADGAGDAPGAERRRSARLGLDTSSLHRTLTAKDASRRRDIWWLLDRLEELRLEGLQIDPSHFPGDDENTLSRLGTIVGRQGYYVEFGASGWDVTLLASRIRLTARFGGKSVRTFCGSERSSQEEIAQLMDLAVPALRHAAGVADAYRVDIAVENHGDFTSAQLRDILERVGHPRVGACLDTGNSLLRGEDPLQCARTLAPHVRTVHLKDWTVSRDADGTVRWTEAIPGRGQVPVREILKLVVAERPGIHIALESDVQPSIEEAETVSREWRHLKESAAAARKILDEI